MDPILSARKNFSSVSEFSNEISQLGWAVGFRQLDCGVGAADFSALMNSNAILQRVHCDRRTKQDVIPPQGFRTFGLPLNTQNSSTIENRPLCNKTFIYVHEQEGFSSVGAPDFDAYTVSLASARISQLSQNLGLPDPGDNTNLWGSEIKPEQEKLAAIKSVIQQIFELHHSQPQTEETQSTLNELIELVLPSAIVQIGASHSADKRIHIRNRELALRRALDYIENHPREAMTVETLCLAGATSLSTLERAFRDRFSISPKRYILVQRLNHVHTALLNKPDERSISDIASDWGFWHMSQFATDYKRLFGYLPSQTARV